MPNSHSDSHSADGHSADSHSADSHSERAAPARVRRPRDAGTLILVRRGRDGPEVLMGRRSAGHVFVPHHYVFPGGAVDPDDGRVVPATTLRPEVEARLTKSCTGRRAKALALAAIRETFEETGLAVGRPRDGAEPDAVPESWRPFYESGVAPALDLILYLARAVTPAGRPRRFDARFFVAEAGHAQGALGGNGELLDLHWAPVAEARALKTRVITQIMLRHLAERLANGAGDLRSQGPVPVYKMLRGRRSLTYE